MSSELAVVVIALRAQPGVEDAVRSLLAQAAGCELLVVSSGGGDVAARLAAADCAVSVREIAAPLYPGAARNVGVAATRARFVAFLAADCRALPGWVEGRAAAHAQGAAVVASAVVNPHRRNPCSWATQALLFARRMPGVPPPRALLYGCSYDRDLLARCGGFREDLRAGEDTELHQRLGGLEVRWCPQVRTAHRHPTTLPGLFADQLARGRRSARAWADLGRPDRRAVARAAFERLPECARLAWTAAEPGDRPWLALALPLLPFAAAAYALGALRAPRSMAPAP
ncbi:MAG: glycosyltransferase family 2 protein [Acidobacteriota bacterium]